MLISDSQRPNQCLLCVIVSTQILHSVSESHYESRKYQLVQHSASVVVTYQRENNKMGKRFDGHAYKIVMSQIRKAGEKILFQSSSNATTESTNKNLEM